MRRRALLSTLHVLPNGYTRLEYIESSGTQYIDTGVIAKTGIESKMEFSFTKVPSDAGMLGARKSGNRFYIVHYYGSFTIGYGEYYTTGVKATAGTKYAIESALLLNEQSMYINGEEVIFKGDSSSLDLGLNLYLFGANYNGSAKYLSSARCYSCKIYDNSVLVRDFVPCVDPSGVYGMYDVVGRQFYSSNSGSFTGA